MERYVLKNGKKLRYGYTTGSCAAAAAKASAIMLKSKGKIDEVEIDTPKGWNLKIQIHDSDFNGKKASCSVVKDSGDDPDVTNGLKIFAEVTSTGRKNIEIIGGKGIGKVTKEGLSLEPGEWAINPTPRKMILEAIRKIFPKGGYRVKLWIPKGEEVAKKTFNPRLGIEGGISIIGTSGIVEPMSEEAFKESIRLEMKMAMANKKQEIIFTFGNYGINFCKKNGINEKNIIKTSNFLGDMLDEAVEYGIKEILIVGHIGKLVKVCGGIFNTHSKVADCRMEILAAYTGINGGDKKLIKNIMESNTTEDSVRILKSQKQVNSGVVYEDIVNVIKNKCTKRIHNKINIEVVMFSQIEGILGMTIKAGERMERFSEK